MGYNRPTEAQIEAGERVLRGERDRNAQKTWSKVRGRLRAWQSLVDLSVREAVLAAAENENPYLLYELAREAIDRMEPWQRGRLSRDLRDLGAGVGTPRGAFPQTRSNPQAAWLVLLLAPRQEWNEETELRPAVKDALGFSKRRTTGLLKDLEREGTLRRWTETLKPDGPGRPRKVGKVALTAGGRHLVQILKPHLGPGKVRERRYWHFKPPDLEALRMAGFTVTPVTGED